MEAQAWVEVWPVAADESGLWLLSDGALYAPTALQADGDPFADVGLVLDQIGYPARGLDNADRPGVRTVHSTSWRMSGPAVNLTFLAALDPHAGYVPDEANAGHPVGLRLADHLGRPATHAPGRLPAVRDFDVLMHGLRHFAFLIQTDATEAEALGPVWAQWLAQWQPTLAGMYSEVHRRAA